MARENRFWVAMALYVALGVLEWNTLSGETLKTVTGPDGQPLFELSIRGVALAILALFAVRTFISERKQALEERIERSRRED